MVVDGNLRRGVRRKRRQKTMNEGNLSRKEFQILTFILENEGKTQREVAQGADMSVGTANKVIADLTEKGYILEGKVTSKGVDALEPYRVKRAVFIAAGFGSRLVPITLNTPKPLVRVNGKRIIDGLLDAVLAAGIEEIIIVRGYLGEQFDQLKYKYPMITFLENPIFNEANNISSAMCARYLLSNAYVFEADLLISNPEIIKKYHYTTNFLGIKMDRSDDWCFDVKNGIITGQKVGGLDCYQMVGISYWNAADGKKLSEHIKLAYEMPGGKEYYWEQVPLKVFAKEYSVEIRECKQDDIIEIDTFRELKAIDKTYDI